MTELNENHRRAILIAFKTLDQTFWRIRRMIAESRDHSPLDDHIDDVSSEQENIIGDCTKKMRAVMLGILARLEISPPSPHISAAWTIRTEIQAASAEAVEALLPRYLRSGGAISPEAARELESIVHKLRDIMNQANQALDALLGSKR